MNKESKQSSTYLFLNTLAYKAETLWPTGERIPFFQREFEERKIRRIVDEKMRKAQKKNGFVDDIKIDLKDIQRVNGKKTVKFGQRSASY